MVSADQNYREISGIALALKIMLLLGAATDAMSILLVKKMLWLFDDPDATQADFLANADLASKLQVISMPLTIGTIVVFCFWIHRAHQNLEPLGARELRFKPLHAWGFFFIPLANLWKPYQAMGDLWKASHNPTFWATSPSSILLPVWWGLWLISTILVRIASMQMNAVKTVEEIQSAAQLAIFGDLARGINCFLALVLVHVITEAQQREQLEQSLRIGADPRKG